MFPVGEESLMSPEDETAHAAQPTEKEAREKQRLDVKCGISVGKRKTASVFNLNMWEIILESRRRQAACLFAVKTLHFPSQRPLRSERWAPCVHQRQQIFVWFLINHRWRAGGSSLKTADSFR